MKFEVINNEGKTVFGTHEVQCIPAMNTIISMSKAGYKFKFDGKQVSKKKLGELLLKHSK